MSETNRGGTTPPDRPVRRPTHRSVLYLPHHAPRVVAEIVPVGRAEGTKAWCKYCHRSHQEWWLMPAEEYPVDIATLEASVRPAFPDFRANDDTRALLCGYCEHVSLAAFMDFEEAS